MPPDFGGNIHPPRSFHCARPSESPSHRSPGVLPSTLL
jgi:hypothetical protein